MASRDAFENNGQNHHTGDASIARLLSGPLRHLGHNNNSNIHDEVTEYLNRPISVLNPAPKDIRYGRTEFANASDCLGTWDDSDSLTAVNAQKN